MSQISYDESFDENDRLLLATIPLGGYQIVTNDRGRRVASSDFKQGISGTAAALAKVFKGKGGGTDAETMILWSKFDASNDEYVTFSSSRGRDVALLAKRLSDASILGVHLSDEINDYVDINISTSVFRSVAHVFKPSGDVVEADPDYVVGDSDAMMQALRELPGKPWGGRGPSGKPWDGWQTPLPGLAKRLVEIYKGRGGGPEAESNVAWHKWATHIDFSSDRGRDVAAVAKRVGDSGIVGFRIPDRPDWPIFLTIRGNLFRTAAHAFKAKRGDDDNDDVDTE